MALFGSTQLGLASVFLTVLLGQSSTGEGFKQELWLYQEDGNALYFNTHVPDLEDYSSILPKVTKRCSIGMWLISTAVNYKEFDKYFGAGSDTKFCSDVNMKAVKSLRYFAANDTATVAISLYSGTDFEGDEIFVTKAKTDISISIGSLAGTGTADWMLYEGQNFDGNSICYQVPSFGKEFRYSKNITITLNMTTIGSIFKGCDLDKIQLHRESLLL